VLRDSPNSHNTYIQILETKFVEQAAADGDGLIPLLYQVPVEESWCRCSTFDCRILTRRGRSLFLANIAKNQQSHMNSTNLNARTRSFLHRLDHSSLILL
jgi:hypothetical protein